MGLNGVHSVSTGYALTSCLLTPIDVISKFVVLKAPTSCRQFNHAALFRLFFFLRSDAARK
jgi:hypothetical protein